MNQKFTKCNTKSYSIIYVSLFTRNITMINSYHNRLLNRTKHSELKWRHAAETINLPTFFILLVSTSSSVWIRLRDPLLLRSGVFLAAGSSIFAWEGPASSSSGGSVPASTFDGPSFSLCPESGSGSVLDGSWSAGSRGSVPASDLVGKFSSGSSVSWNTYVF